MPFFGPPLHQHIPFRHRSAPFLSCILHFVRMWICYVRCLRYRLPPSKHSPPAPVGHGRGLASRPGCAGPGEGVGSPWLHLATSGVRRYCSAPPASARLRPASPTPKETPQGSCRLPGSQPLLAIARDSLCLPPVMPYLIRRGYCRPTLLPCPSASTGPAASLAEPGHASFFIVPLSLP